MRPELLARLTPGCVSLDLTSRATGQRLTDSDIAAALSGCSDAQMWLAQIKYMGYDQYKPKLIRYVYEWVADAACIEHWRLKKGSNLMRRISECSVYECVDPGRCSSCYGVGHITRGKVIIACRTCDGAGNVRLTDRVRSRSLETNINTYRAVWKRRYLDILGRLNAIDQGIIDILARQ